MYLYLRKFQSIWPHACSSAKLMHKLQRKDVTILHMNMIVMADPVTCTTTAQHLAAHNSICSKLLMVEKCYSCKNIFAGKGLCNFKTVIAPTGKKVLPSNRIEITNQKLSQYLPVSYCMAEGN